MTILYKENSLSEERAKKLRELGIVDSKVKLDVEEVEFQGLNAVFISSADSEVDTELEESEHKVKKQRIYPPPKVEAHFPRKVERPSITTVEKLRSPIR